MRATATIVPDEDAPAPGIELPLIRTSPDGDSEPDLSVRGTLGEGGMGIVHLARQVPLARDVAVKRPRDARNVRAAERVLHEALVTGLLEHPNVVPIHVLGQDEEGTPLIVMKRVEGVSWLQVLDDPSTSPTEEEVDLEWHLNVLLQLCNALRFAHSRGVIHRDVKPENVMLGGFGEVYLVDWGIAVSTEATNDRRITSREEARGVAGSPAYMAPEMTRDDAMEVDHRTDVYLLGATLHEVLVGAPPHSGGSLFEVMLSAYESKPQEYPEEVPEELVSLVHRAMNVSRDARFQSVEDFREALLDFLQHRAAVALVEEAEARLERARHLVEEGAGEQLAELNNLFAETRFGFQQAVRQWPSYERALQGIEDIGRVQFRHLINRRDEAGAAAILADIDAPELTRELERLRAELAKEREEVERLRELERDEDLRIGWRTRIGLGFTVAGFWGLSAWAKAYNRWGIEPSELEPDYLRSLLFTIGVPVVLIIIFRKLIVANAFNRRLVHLLLAVLVAIGMTRLVAHLMDVPLVVTTAFEFVLFGFAAMALGVMTDMKIALSSVAIFAAAVLAAIYPSAQMIFIAVAVFVFALHQGYMWRPGRFVEDEPGPPEEPE